MIQTKFNINDIVSTPNKGNGIIKSIHPSYSNGYLYLVYHSDTDQEFWYSEDFLNKENEVYLTE